MKRKKRKSPTATALHGSVYSVIECLCSIPAPTDDERILFSIHAIHDTMHI